MTLSDKVKEYQQCLADPAQPIAKRMRTIFLLKQIGNQEAIDALMTGFKTGSVLQSHEIAYVLGQLQDTYALPCLISLLEDAKEHPIVRHEAAEALHAIGCVDALPILKKYCEDPCDEVAASCKLAVEGFEFKLSAKENNESDSAYMSVDPAPPSKEKSVAKLREILCDTKLSMFQRYRAMFALRNMNTEEAVLALAEGFADESPVFRHEVAYVFGQMQHPASVPALAKMLEKDDEHPMVRHEAAEALGSIATSDVFPLLEKYRQSKHSIVKESCDVALDLADYWTNDEKSTAFDE